MFLPIHFNTKLTIYQIYRFTIFHYSNKIKIKGLLTEEEYVVNEVKGNLTAQEVFERIQKHWETEN